MEIVVGLKVSLYIYKMVNSSAHQQQNPYSSSTIHFHWNAPAIIKLKWKRIAEEEGCGEGGEGDILCNILKERKIGLGNREYYNLLGTSLTYLTMQINSAGYSFYERVASSNEIRTMSQRTRIFSYFWYWEAKQKYLVECFVMYLIIRSSRWSCRQSAPLKRRSTFTKLYSVISQKDAIFILAAVRTWNLTQLLVCLTMLCQLLHHNMFCCLLVVAYYSSVFRAPVCAYFVVPTCCIPFFLHSWYRPNQSSCFTPFLPLATSEAYSIFLSRVTLSGQKTWRFLS
jgi:hypothetical protein